MPTALLVRSLDSLLEEWPLAGPLLSRHGVEFCCAGTLTLGEAIQRARADTGAILDALARLSREPAVDPESLDTPALIAYLLERFHATHREELPQLIQWAEKVERVHADHPECPRGLAALLTDALDELVHHMEKEEQILFPLLVQGHGTMVLMPMQVMRHEHIGHEARLREIERLTRQLRLPSEACRTWTHLYQGLEHLLSELRAHIALENDVLFARNDG